MKNSIFATTKYFAALKGTRLTMDIRQLRFLRPDVAALDVDAGLFGAQIQPPGVTAWPDGSFRTCLLMVLTKERGGGKSPPIIMCGGRQAAECRPGIGFCALHA